MSEEPKGEAGAGPPERRGRRRDGERPARVAVELPVLGVPVHFEADAAALREAVESAYGGWRAAVEAPAEPAPPVTGARAADPSGKGARAAGPAARRGISPLPRVELRLDRAAGESGLGVLRVEPSGADGLRVDGCGLAGRADGVRFEASARVSPGLLSDPGLFRDVVDTLVLFLVTRLDRVPIHAAAIEAGGRALVLVGPSGAGKSTLAYAAARSGLRVLADDAVYVQLEPRLRVWGPLRRLYLTPDAAAKYPELAGVAPVWRPNGKRKVGAEAGRGAVAACADRAGLCLLERGPGPVQAEPVAVEEAVARAAARPEPGFDRFRDVAGAALRAIAAGGAWRLRLSPDAGDAIPALTGLLQQIRK